MAITKAQEERRMEKPPEGERIVLPDETIAKRIRLQFIEEGELKRNQFKILLPDPESKISGTTCVGFFSTKIAKQAKGVLKKKIENYKKLGWELTISYDRIVIKNGPITPVEKTKIIETLKQMTIFEKPVFLK